MRINIVSILVVTVVAVLCGFLGGVGIPFLKEQSEYRENDNMKNQLDKQHSSIMGRIRSNITTTGNYLSMTADSLEELYNIAIEDGIFDLDSMQLIADHPRVYSSFDIKRITYFRIIRNETELDQHIEFGKNLYNVSEFRPYNLSRGSPVFIEGNYSFPMALLLITTPFRDSPGLPSVGTFNAISPAEQESIDIIRMPDGAISISEILSTVRVDGSINRNVNTINKFRSWFTVAQFEPDEFLNTLLAEEIERKDVIVRVADNTGSFYETIEMEESANSKTTRLEFLFRYWDITTIATPGFNSEFSTNTGKVIEIAGIIGILLILTIFIVSVYAYESRIEKSIIQTANIINNANNILLHEVKNVIQPAYMFMTSNIQLSDRILEKIVRSLDNTLKIIKNSLDYQKLLNGTYKLTLENVDPLEVIRDVVSMYKSGNIILTHNNIRRMNLDTRKFMELINNSISNALKHHGGKPILLRLQDIDGYLLFEVVNYPAEAPERLDNSVFIPFYINEGDRGVWESTMKLLSPSKKVRNIVASHLGTANLEHTEELKNIEGNIYIKSNSYGLGLSITRLISKALGGDCDVYYKADEGYVRFWAYIEYHPVDEIENPDDNNNKQTAETIV